MPGEFYFMGLGALGVSLAGFAGLIAALDRRATAHSPVAAWRIRNIVIGGFMLTLAGFGVVALYSVTDGDLPMTVRITGALLAAGNFARAMAENRPGPAWPSRSNWWFATVSQVLLITGYLVSAALGRVGLLQLLLIFQLLDPISVFFKTILDVAAGEAGTPNTTGNSGQA